MRSEGGGWSIWSVSFIWFVWCNEQERRDRQDKPERHPNHEMSRLFPQGNFDHQTAHDVIQLKVLLRAVRMGIVTANAGLADGAVGVDGPEIGLIAALDRTGSRSFWMFTHSF